MRMWKVGELAKRTGLTVRTLHHWDAVGLASPRRRTPAGHRLYGEDDVARLQQVLALREVGFPLERIRELLDGGRVSPADALRLHVAHLKEQIERQQRLCTRLDRLQQSLAAAETVSADDILNAIREMTMIEKYYTPEQLETLRLRREALGEEGMRAAEDEWPRLIAEMGEHMQRGTDPRSEAVQALARRWKELVEAFTGGDPAMEQSLRTLYAQEPEMRERSGLDPELTAYVGRAMEQNR